VSNDRDDGDDFIRLIAHDLRTPLGAMQLNAQLIERLAGQDGREKEVRWAGFIASSARKMDHMIQLLVEAERVRSGRIPLVCETITFATWLEERLAGLPTAEGLRPSVVVTDRSSAISADLRRLQQALLILLEIARQAFDAEAPMSIAVGRQGAEVVCSIRGPKLGAASHEKSQLTAGHDIEVHYVNAVLEAHGGSLGFSVSDETAMGFDVKLPALTSSCT
jgi:signal transduction histidine kinase